MRVKFFVVSLLLSIATTALASSPMDAIFKSRFEGGYRRNYCADNIRDLAKAAQEAGLSLRNTKIVEIINRYDQGYETSRVWGDHVRAWRPGTPPGSEFWNYHVILEHDGYIYDFDFGNAPEILPAKGYLMKMFLSSPAKPSGITGCKEERRGLCLDVILHPALEKVSGRPYQKERMKLTEYFNAFI